MHSTPAVQTTTTVHPTAEVSQHAIIGPGTKIWHQAQVREGAMIGANCIIGKGAYIDFGVSIGTNSKLQNGVFVYHGATIEEGVFLGPGVILTNDRSPRAINVDGTQKSDNDWQVTPIRVMRGASIGARAVILPGVTIGEYAMVGAGAVVTRHVPAYGLVYGNPARLHGHVCHCGAVLSRAGDEHAGPSHADSYWECPSCHQPFEFRAELETVQPVSDSGDELMPMLMPLYAASTSPTTSRS
ncbi:MAG: N-acetyltransferase [Caldilineaceae bacterium]|nr:N-acetyltransferase [Caldilineaceae bacterium]